MATAEAVQAGDRTRGKRDNPSGALSLRGAAGEMSGDSRWPCGHAQQGSYDSGKWMHHTHGNLPLGNPQELVGTPGQPGRPTPSGESGEPLWLFCATPGLPPPGRRPRGSTPALTLPAPAHCLVPLYKQPRENAFHGDRLRSPTRETHGTFAERELALSEHTYKCDEGLAVKVKGSHVPFKNIRILGKTSEMASSSCI